MAETLKTPKTTNATPLRHRSPLEMYNYFKQYVDLGAGFIYVTFMEEDPQVGALVRAGRTGREHLNDDIAIQIGGSATKNVGFLKEIMSVVVRTFTGHFQFVHTEIAFKLSETGKKTHGADKLLAVYVNTNENVGMRWRGFNASYKWFYLKANPAQLDSMLKFACATNGEPFSEKLRNNSVTFPGKEEQHGWYCSKHVATALRCLDCEMFHLNRTNTLTVDELYHMVDACGLNAPHLAQKAPVLLETIFSKESVDAVIYQKYKKPDNQ